MGITRSVSFSIVSFLAPGLELWPPMSIMSAPSKSIFSTWFSILYSELYSPPSKKESGVIYKIPIILGFVKSRRVPFILIVILNF